MKVLNYTPHTIAICGPDGTVVREIPSSGIARVAVKSEALPSVDGIPVVSTAYGDVEGLPEPVQGHALVVSMVVLAALPNRTDLYRPDTSPANVVRDADGKIIGVKALTR